MTPIRLLLALLTVAVSGQAFAGPPLTMDDPGILLPGQWEIIAAAAQTSTDSGDVLQAPLIDVSLGLIEDRVQIALVVPFERVSPTGASSSSDFGNLEFGVKWRFYASERFELAVSPYLVFGVSATTAAKGIGSEQDSTVIPVVAQYQLNDTWTLNGELGFASVHGADDAWGYGAALAYAPGGRTTWLFELYGTADSEFANESLEIRAGLDAALRDDLHLLFSVASGVDAPTAAGELDAAVFLGLQLFR